MSDKSDEQGSFDGSKLGQANDAAEKNSLRRGDKPPPGTAITDTKANKIYNTIEQQTAMKALRFQSHIMAALKLLTKNNIWLARG